MGLIDLGLRPSGKRFTTLMRGIILETASLLFNFGSGEIGNLPSKTLMVRESEGPENPLPSMGQKSFPELPPKGDGEVGKRRVKTGSCSSNSSKPAAAGPA